MPTGVMVILVVHCLHDLPVPEARAAAPLAALTVTRACACGAATHC